MRLDRGGDDGLDDPFTSRHETRRKLLHALPTLALLLFGHIRLTKGREVLLLFRDAPPQAAQLIRTLSLQHERRLDHWRAVNLTALTSRYVFAVSSGTCSSRYSCGTHERPHFSSNFRRLASKILLYSASSSRLNAAPWK